LQSRQCPRDAKYDDGCYGESLAGAVCHQVISLADEFGRTRGERASSKAACSAAWLTGVRGRAFLEWHAGQLLLLGDECRRRGAGYVDEHPEIIDDEMRQYRKVLQHEAAADFALTRLVEKLMLEGTVRLTPHLFTQPGPGPEITDCISGVFEVDKPLTTADADMLIEETAAQFTKT